MKRIFAAVLTVLILLSACSKPTEQENDILPESENSSESSEQKSIENFIPTPINVDYPESSYVLDTEHFVNRENDEYIKYLFGILCSANWKAATGVSWTDYQGFSSPAELNSDLLVNIFFKIADSYYENYSFDNITCKIPVNDIYNLLDKYFEDYTLDLHDTSYNFSFTNDDEYVISPGFISVGAEFRSGYRIENVSDNGDGTVSIEIITNEETMVDDEIVATGKDGYSWTFKIKPENDRCRILCLTVETVNQSSESELNVLDDETRTMADLIENFPQEFSSCEELDKASVSDYTLWKIYYAGQAYEGKNGCYYVSETTASQYAKSLFSIDNMEFDTDPGTGKILFYPLGEASIYDAEILSTVRGDDTIVCTAKVVNTFTGEDVFMTEEERTRTFIYTFGISSGEISPVYLISSKQIK
jgi:hypothetical protein